MKLKVWNEERTNDALGQLYLKLKEVGSDHIVMYICDSEGKELEYGAHILDVDNDLKVIVLLEGVNEKVPLKTDLVDSVMVYDQQDIVRMEKNRVMKEFANHVAKCQGDLDEETEGTSH